MSSNAQFLNTISLNKLDYLTQVEQKQLESAIGEQLHLLSTQDPSSEVFSEAKQTIDLFITYLALSHTQKHLLQDVLAIASQVGLSSSIRSALSLSIQYEDIEAAILLGPYLNLEDHHSDFLCKAIHSQNFKLVEWILPQSDPNAQDDAPIQQALRLHNPLKLESSEIAALLFSKRNPHCDYSEALRKSIAANNTFLFDLILPHFNLAIAEHHQVLSDYLSTPHFHDARYATYLTRIEGVFAHHEKTQLMEQMTLNTNTPVLIARRRAL